MTEIKQFRPDGGFSSGLPRVPPQPAEILDCDEPQQYRHLYFYDEAHKFRAGVWGCSAFATKLVAQKSHELVVVVDGEVIIANESGRETTFQVGDAFVIPGGMRRRWIHKAMATAYFVSYEGSGPSEEQDVVVIDPAAALAPSPPPSPEVLLTATPTTRINFAYEDPSKAWSAGIWDATPYHRKILPFPRYEFMQLLEGEVTFTDQGGKILRFRKGDSFLVPPGAMTDWQNLAYVRKVFSVFRPPA